MDENLEKKGRSCWKILGNKGKTLEKFRLTKSDYFVCVFF